VTTWLLFALLGLGSGSVYAALAIGLILIHRGSGVVNLAHGALAMFPAIVFVQLRTDGVLVLPVIGIPGRIDFGAPVPTAVAFVVAVSMGALIGAVSYLLIFRRLRDAPPVTRLVASVGLTIVLQGAAIAQVGTATQRTPPLLPGDVVRMLGSPVPVDRFWLAGVVVVMGLGVAALYRFTRFGIATRAAAESEKGAVLLGYSPVALGLANWVLASTLAAVVGVLVSPISGVNPFNYSLFIVPALAAALAARLRSIVTALVVGLALGMFEGVAVHVVSRRQVPNFLLGGFDTLVPFAAIVIALVVMGRSVPDRGTVLEHRHPSAPFPILDRRIVLPLLVLAVGVMWFGSSGLRLAAITSMMVALLCLSIVVLTGYVGQVSLAQLSLAGFSAFMLSRFADRWGLPFPVAPLLALGATTLLGVLVSLPALRIRGIQYAIVTLAAAVAIEQLLFRSPSFTGFGGVAHVDAPEVFGFRFGIIGPGEYPYRPFGFFVLGLTVLGVVIVANVRRSAFGRRLLAIRANERAAAAAGVDVARAKISAAAVASFLAGMSGVVFAYKNVDFSWAGLEASRGLQVLALAYLGGVGSIAGAVIAGLLAPSGVFAILLVAAGGLGQQLLLTGIGLIIVTIRFPGGIASAGPWFVSLVDRVVVSSRDGPTRRRSDRDDDHDDNDALEVVQLEESHPRP
jgi:branched-chain amino acid transport system permease protein